MSTIAELAEKFEKLLNRLPGGIRTPVQKEWRPLNELFLQRRAPRLVIIGSQAERFLREVLSPTQSAPARPEGDTAAPEVPGWQRFQDAGLIHYALALDHPHTALAALRHAPADCFIITRSREEPVENLRKDLALLLELYQANTHRDTPPSPRPPSPEKSGTPILCFTREPLSPEESAALWAEIPTEFVAAVQAILPFEDRSTALRAVGKTLPQQGQLEFARATGERTVQREIAHSLIRSTTAVCTAIGTQPIPLADFPILSSLQFMMIAGIVHISGRQWSVATVRDFVAALGFNVGAGLLLREGARSAIKLLPGFLNLISGALAGAGTYGIGFAASAYFIDGLGIKEARKHVKIGFRRRKQHPLRDETPPRLSPPRG